jgi:hypothetical protein
MSQTANFPPSAGPGQPSAETLRLAREGVRSLLLSTPAFRALPPSAQREIAMNTVQVVSYLAEPEGIRANRLGGDPPESPAKVDPYALSLSAPPLGSQQASTSEPRSGTGDPGQFRAQAAREGAAVAGALLTAVNFPTFVSSLIQGVFHAIVQSSMEQMEAYGKLVADVAKTLNQFRDDNVSVNQGRDHLVDQFPDTFRLDIDTGEDGGPRPRVRLREGVDESQALKKVNSLPVEGGPVTSLDDDTIEDKLVPAARTQLATSRQQLLATMVLMGINRIVVTDGRISAKVMYDFQARDNLKYRYSATQFDYGDQYRYTSQGDYESQSEGAQSSHTRSKDGAYDDEQRDASYYSKGTYRNTAEPVLKLVSATTADTDAALQTRASLAGQVEVNFKSDYLPLERMADSFQIGRIQDAARPTSTAPAAGGQPATAPATPPSAAPPAAAPRP